MKINVTGGIGYDFTAENLREKIAGHTGDIELYINSPGGDVYEGVELYNEIRRYINETGSKVTAFYSGFVASAASYFSMAASERIAYDNSVFMLHNAAMIAMGDNRIFQFWADDLKKTDNIIALGYSKASGKSKEEIKAMMEAGEENNGTYLYGEEIKEMGFANAIMDSEDGGDKENKTKEGKILHANFQKTAKAKTYDHDRIVALVKDFEINSREADKKGEKTVDKKELLEALNTMKENNAISLQEVAKSMAVSDLLVSEEQLKSLSTFGEVKKLCGDADPIEFVKALLEEKKANAESVRKAKLDEVFGPEKSKETGKVNHSRSFAETFIGDAELTDEKISEVKENEVYKKLAADVADVNSDYNRIEKDDKTEIPSGPAVVTV